MNKERIGQRNIMLGNKNRDYSFIVRTKHYNSDLVVVESYCPDPKCQCREVKLTFHKSNENKEIGKEVFAIILNIDTMEMARKEIFEPLIRVDEIVKELIEEDGDKLRPVFNHNYNISKGIDEQIPYEKIDNEVKELVLRGSCVAYDEVFNTVESITFRDKENKLIFVDDQYCMNPKCKCDEVILSFAEVDEAVSKSINLFTLRYSLNSGKYEIEFKGCRKERLEEILQIFKNEEKQIREKFKKRVKAMKEVGGKIILGGRKVEPKENTEAKVGRNDPCPCGSGKKYKKCCG